MTDDLRVSRSLTIPADELELRFTPSGGPGGQHANRSATRVEVVWNVDRSRALGDRQRRAIRSKLRHRIDASGNIRVASDARRSQLMNRQDALRRLAQLLGDALVPAKDRIETRPTRASTERRLQDKRRRAEIKRGRSARDDF